MMFKSEAHCGIWKEASTCTTEERKSERNEDMMIRDK
jgi:hypothetical protein